VSYAADIDVKVPRWAEFRAQGLDVSYGGMSLIFPQRLRQGDRLIFGLALGDGTPIQVPAVVRNVAPLGTGRFRVGLEWADLRGDERSEVRMFVDTVANRDAA
jgi:c-di-GMP-binding flagellar brake protein YcgR